MGIVYYASKIGGCRPNILQVTITWRMLHECLSNTTPVIDLSTRHDTTLQAIINLVNNFIRTRNYGELLLQKIDFFWWHIYRQSRCQ